MLGCQTLPSTPHHATQAEVCFAACRFAAGSRGKGRWAAAHSYTIFTDTMPISHPPTPYYNKLAQRHSFVKEFNRALHQHAILVLCPITKHTKTNRTNQQQKVMNAIHKSNSLSFFTHTCTRILSFQIPY